MWRGLHPPNVCCMRCGGVYTPPMLNVLGVEGCTPYPHVRLVRFEGVDIPTTFDALVWRAVQASNV